MKKRVIWIGSGKRCRPLMKAYSGSVDSLHTCNISKGFLKKHAPDFAAAVMVSDKKGYAEIKHCRALFEYSAGKRFPVLFFGSRRGLHAIITTYPKALVFRADEKKLLIDPDAAVSSEAVEKPNAVVVFSNDPEYYAYCEEKAEEYGAVRLRMIYCRPAQVNLTRLKERGIKPKLFVFCGDTAKKLNTKAAGFSKVPFVMLHCSDEPPADDFAPLAIIDARKDGDELKRYFAAAAEGKALVRNADDPDIIR